MQKYWLQSSKSLEKRYELILLDQETALYFWYKIIVCPDDATDSSVYSGACFHYFLLKCCFEKGVCENIGLEAQNH